MPYAAVLLIVDAMVTTVAVTTDFSRMTGPIACHGRRDEMPVSRRYPFRGGAFDPPPFADLIDLTYLENRILPNRRAEAVDRHCVTPGIGQRDFVKCRRGTRHLPTL